MWKTRPQLTPADLAKIQAPTLLLVGEDDNITPAHTLQMQEAIPDATRVVIPNAGHGLICDTPKAVNTAIMQFLSEGEIER